MPAMLNATVTCIGPKGIFTLDCEPRKYMYTKCGAKKALTLFPMMHQLSVYSTTVKASFFAANHMADKHLMAALRPASVLRKTRNASALPIQMQWRGRRWQTTDQKANHRDKEPRPNQRSTSTFDDLMSQMERDYHYPAPKSFTRKPGFVPGYEARDVPSTSTVKTAPPQFINQDTKADKPASRPPTFLRSDPAELFDTFAEPAEPSPSPVPSIGAASPSEGVVERADISLTEKPQEQTRSEVRTSKKRLDSTWSEIKISNRLRNFNHVFLRDSCTCPKCVDTSTRQKLFATTDIPAQIRPKSLLAGDDVVTITWENDIPSYSSDHTTHLSYQFLKQSFSRHPVKQFRLGKQAWDVDHLRGVNIDYDYSSYMSDDKVLGDALRKLHKYGLVFIKNVPELESSVVDTANRIGPLKNTFYGDTWNVRSVTNAKNVAYTDIDLGFHMDLLYMHQPPRLQLLHCLRASTHGGMSLFSDSYMAAWKLYNQDRESFDVLTSTNVNFHYDNDSHLYHQSRRTIQLDKELPRSKKLDISEFVGHLDAVNWAPPFQGPFHQIGDFDLARDVHKWHKAARKFRDLIETKSMIYERQMAPSECVIFDNRRALHARTAFHGGERWLRGAYLDSDPFLSKCRVLERDGDRMN